jgi:Domain of unknown function (DUF4124)
MLLAASHRTLGRAAATIALATLACTAGAQVYRIVGPDGKVTFSDKPPADAGAKSATTTPGNAGAGACGSGRAFLGSRGVPFTEKTVGTEQDVAALQRLSGKASLPFLTIGGQQLTGYSEAEWAQFLDAAGYPRTSQLPASYRNPPASPLVATAEPQQPAAAAPARAPAAAAPAAAPAPTGSNPAGIQF